MKKIILTLLAVFALSAAQAEVKTEITVEKRGEELTLTAPDGYTTYYWETSYDGRAFYRIPGATEKTYTFNVYTPAYYRLRVTDAENKGTYIDTTRVQLPAVSYAKTFSVVSGAQGYVEVNGRPGSGITMNGENRTSGTLVGNERDLTNWTNKNAHAAYYVHHPGRIMDGFLAMTVQSGRTVTLRVKMFDPAKLDNPMVDTYICLRGTGKPDTVMVFGYQKLPKAQYYRYDIECVAGNTYLTNIDCWIFRTNIAATGTNKSYPAGYLSSPSVHLNNWGTTNSAAPTGRAYDWCYQEIMIDENSDVTGTYAMSLGVLKGYMGIQVNGENRRDVIFSIWDDGDTDSNPELAEHLRAGTIDASDFVEIGRFGNEGTGTKAFCSGNYWKPGRYVQFITNARPEVRTVTIKNADGTKKTISQECTLVSAWFNALDGKGWQYIATTRLPSAGQYFNGWYSFLENYNWPTGQVYRKAYYKNGYMHARSSKKWYHRNQVSFGHTDGGTSEGARNDYGQGRDKGDPKAFFMSTGGYVPTVTNENTVTLNTDNTPVDTINLDALLARVDQAVEKEAEAIREAEEIANNSYDPTGWQVTKFSSEEKTGEGSNGRAQQIIDGDNATYWHSAWQSGTASLPHYFVVDMKKELPIQGFHFTLSGGTQRHQKAIEILTSSDGKTFKSIYTNSNCPDEETYYLRLKEVVNARYFRLNIKTTQSGVVHTRINEIRVVAPSDDPTGITPVGTGTTGKLVLTQIARSRIVLQAPEAAGEMTVSLHGVAGDRLFSQKAYGVQGGQQVALDLPTLPAGVYIVSCKAAGRTYSKAVLLK